MIYYYDYISDRTAIEHQRNCAKGILSKGFSHKTSGLTNLGDLQGKLCRVRKTLTRKAAFADHVLAVRNKVRCMLNVTGYSVPASHTVEIPLDRRFVYLGHLQH